MRNVVPTIILFVSFCELILCTGHFTVIGSKSINQYGKYSVAITSRKYDDLNSPILEVAINSKDGVRRLAQNITLTNSTNQSVEFDMNGSIVGDYVNLSINCIRGLTFNQTVKLNLNTRNVSAFVQTDKPIYKPSDEVRFRVLILDENLMPLKASNVQIFVIDGAQNRVKQFHAVFKKGVYSGVFKLSDFPVLGNWYTETLVSNNVKKIKAFEVAEYTRPTFEIILDVKSHVSFDEGRIIAFLVAKHTFAEAAKGNAVITAEVEKNKVTKPVEIRGNTSVEFHIESELRLTKENGDRTVKLFVTFIEELTGKTQNATASVQVHSSPYKLFMKTKSTEFKPGLPYTIEAMVQHHDTNELVTDKENPVTFKVTFVKQESCNYVRIDRGPGKRTRIRFEPVCSGGRSDSNESTVYPTNGTSKIDFIVPEYPDFLNVTITYLQTKITNNKISRASKLRKHFITIKSKTKIPKLNQNVTINIQSLKPFTEFSYHVFSIQGRVIASDTIQVQSTQDHDFVFTPTDVMESEIKIIVFYIADNDEFARDSLNLKFGEFRNSVELQISEESVNPKEEIYINITSQPNSFVGLLATDQSLSILKRVNNFNDKIKHKKKWNIFYIAYPRSKDFIPMNGRDYDEPYKDEDEVEEFDLIETREVEYRKSFFESWFFKSVDFAVNQTNAVIPGNVTDTITSWTLIAFSINPTTGFAETSWLVLKLLKVFKEFFISMDLPYSVKQNEIVSIPISVFNYMEDDQDANITLYNENSEFIFIEPDNDEKWKEGSNQQRRKILFVRKNSGASTSFKIRANQIGSIKIKALVTSLSSTGDGIEQFLLVKPKGFTQYMNKALLIDLRGEYTTNLTIVIPSQAVDGTTRIEASIVGDILGLPGNLKNLLKLPVGCSEQNMINFVPNIVVLDYLKAVNKLTKEIEDDAIEYLELGYQNQLNYKNDDGSFNVWGKTNEPGSIWLTAFIIKSFGQAKKYIFIESEIIRKGLRFLTQTQLGDGSFEEVGYVFRKDIQSASTNKMALTAYVLITFLENSDYVETRNNVIVKAVSFLGQNFNSITNNYSLAIVAYALQLADLGDETLKNISLTKLEETAIRDGDTMRWKGSGSEYYDHNNLFDNKANSLDVETTAYALHAFVVAGRLDNSVQITKWLVTQRNENGGFISTQDTVVALQALSQVAAKIDSSNINMDVTINYGTSSPVEFNVNSRKALLLQTENLPPSARYFEITAIGVGFAIFQISYQYNMVQSVDQMYKFNISRPIHGTVNEETFYLQFCVNYIPDENSSTSNMAVLEVEFPTGCTFAENFLKELESTKNIKGVHYHGTSVIAYLDHLSAENVCPRFHYSKGDNHAQHGTINVYDYYNIKNRAETTF